MLRAFVAALLGFSALSRVASNMKLSGLVADEHQRLHLGSNRL